MDEIRIAPFGRLDPIERSGLVACFGGDEDLAEGFWEEVVLLVESAKKYGFTLQSTKRQSTSKREGVALDQHMSDVAKASRALRNLLDADTFFHLTTRPVDLLSLSDQPQNAQRVRDIKRLLGELESEIRGNDWKSVTRFRLTRLDFFLARAIPNMLLRSERAKPFHVKHKRLISIVFRALGIGTEVSDAIDGAARHT